MTVADPHSPFVEALGSDWAALLRYWLAHDYRPALRRAIDALSQRANEDENWLNEYLTEVFTKPQTGREVFFRSIPLDWDAHQLNSVELLKLCPVMAMISQAERGLPLAPEPIRKALVLCDKMQLYAAQLDDRPISVGCVSICSRLHRLANTFSEARDYCQLALALYRELAEERPAVYQPFVAAEWERLAGIHRSLADREGACQAYREASRLYRKLSQGRPDAYLATVNRLEIALGELHYERGDRNTARNYLWSALGRQQQWHDPPSKARALILLGRIQRELNDPGGADASFANAIRILGPSNPTDATEYLNERLCAHDEQGRLLLEHQEVLGWPDWNRARQSFREALNAAELLRGRCDDPIERRRVLRENQSIYDVLLRVCLELYQSGQHEDALDEAIEVAEANRLRPILDLMPNVDEEPERIPDELWDEFKKLRWRRQAAWLRRGATDDTPPAPAIEMGASGSRGRQASPPDSVREQSNAIAQPTSPRVARPTTPRTPDDLETEFNEVLRRVRELEPNFNPENMLKPISREAIRQLIPTDIPTAIVQFHLTPDRAWALIQTTSTAEAIPLAGLNSRRVADQLRVWLTCYAQETTVGYDDRPSAWSNSVEYLFRPISAELLWPITDRLNQLLPPDTTTRSGDRKRRLILVPHQALHHFPIHAGRLNNDAYLLDEFEIVYAPSLSLLNRCSQQTRTATRNLLAVTNPTNDLPFANAEVESIRHYFGDQQKIIPAADNLRDQLLREWPHVQVFHYAGHSTFDADDSMSSALLLGPGGNLTLRDVFLDFRVPNAQLVVLSSCDSGRHRPDSLDELIGLTTGFLFAGASSVLSTLWKANDLAAALVMDQFYRAWLLDGKSMAASLGIAQRWLRQLRACDVLEHLQTPPFRNSLDTAQASSGFWSSAMDHWRRNPDMMPFALPFYWAPFIITGVGYPLPTGPA
jgi:CHAT domain-containing protein/tetratricopeptide (TPR) repeat protein